MKDRFLRGWGDIKVRAYYVRRKEETDVRYASLDQPADYERLRTGMGAEWNRRSSIEDEAWCPLL
jgi:hypothetical protein